MRLAASYSTGFDLHARLVMRPQPWALKREHGDLSPVSAESKLETLVPETVTTVEEFVAFKAAGVRLSTKPEQPSANGRNFRDSVLLFALDAGPNDLLLELTS